MNPIYKSIAKFLAPMLLDFIVPVLEDLAKKSDNTVDDHAVKTIRDNLNIIKEAIKVV